VSTQTQAFDGTATAEILAELDCSGYVHIPSVLSPEEVADLRAIVDQLAEEHYEPSQGFVHALGATYLHPALMDLGVDTRLLAVLSGALTPNIHIYHSHIDVHPPEEDTGTAWRWHEDGGRQTADLDYRARLSVKLGWWLSDCEEEGYGNLEVIPGSHLWTEPLPRTPGKTPDGAIPVLAKAGDVTLFERRIWHGRGTNVSDRTRAVVFYGYSPRWVTQREFPSAEQLAAAEGDPLRRQLIGAPDWDTCHVGRAELPVTQYLAAHAA
jgi:ectoine hydroxylase-related dioxygenase (phytanoyl-CoA dioxygenase family)